MKLFAMCISAISVVAILDAARTPASAALTASLTATIPSYTGACPTTLAFSGAISGTHGTSFQYSLNRFVNGVQQVVNVGPATLPASGTMSVSDSISVGASTGGNTFDQIWVHNISGGHPDVYSAKAPFSVACATPKPTPTPTPKAAHNAPSAPFDLHYTTDLAKCTQLASSASCQELNGQRALLLFWSWKCSGAGPCSNVRYRVWRAGDGFTSVGQVGGRYAIVTRPIGGWHGACYAVSAYRTTHGTSSDSERTPNRCIDAVTQEVSIAPSIVRGYAWTYSRLYSDNSHMSQPNGPVQKSLPFGIGYQYRQQVGFSQTNQFYRGAFAFQRAPLQGATIIAGKFAYDVDSGGGCADLYLAPSSWESARFPQPPSYARVIDAASVIPKHGKTYEGPIDKTLWAWTGQHDLAFMLAEHFGNEAEHVRSADEGPQFSCFSWVTEVRLVVTVGVTA